MSITLDEYRKLRQEAQAQREKEQRQSEARPPVRSSLRPASAPSDPRETIPLRQELTRGLAMGARGVMQGWHGTRAMMRPTEEGRQESLAKYQQLGERTQENMISVPQFTEIRHPGEAVRWGLGQIGAMAPIVGSIMAGGAVGGKIGLMAGPKGAVVGSVAGSFSAGYMLYAGSLYGDIREAGGGHEDARLAALKYGAPASAVSIVVPMGAYASVMGYLGRDFVKQKIKRAVVGAALSTPAEGIAEGIAESFVIAGEETVLGKRMTREEKWARIKDAAAAGGLMGFGMGAVGGAGRKTGNIDTMIDAFLDDVEAAYKSGDRSVILQTAISNMEKIKNPTEDQQAILDYLKTEVATHNRPLNRGLRAIESVTKEVVERPGEINVRRHQELVGLLNGEGLTSSEVLELTAIVANKLHEPGQKASDAKKVLDEVAEPGEEVATAKEVLTEEAEEQEAAQPPQAQETETEKEEPFIPVSPMQEQQADTSVFQRMPDDQLKQMANQGVLGAQQELARREKAKTKGEETHDEKAGPSTKEAQEEARAEEEDSIVNQIIKGDFQDKPFEFPDTFSPLDINSLWDDLYVATEEISEKNKPAIDALVKELTSLKSRRDKASNERKKKIREEIQEIQSEAGIASYHAEEAFLKAQEAMAKKVVTELKKEGVEVDEVDAGELLAELSDGRLNEQGWNDPILPQLMRMLSKQRETSTPTPTEKVASEPSFEVVESPVEADPGKTAGTAGKDRKKAARPATDVADKSGQELAEIIRDRTLARVKGVLTAEQVRHSRTGALLTLERAASEVLGEVVAERERAGEPLEDYAINVWNKEFIAREILQYAEENNLFIKEEITGDESNAVEEAGRGEQKESRTIVAEKNLMKQAEDAYSGQTISEKQSIKKPFIFEGKPHISTGGTNLSQNIWEVIPIQNYKGQTHTYTETITQVGPGKTFGYEGMRVKRGGKEFVLSDMKKLERSLPSNEEAIADLKKQYEAGGYWTTKHETFNDAVRGRLEHAKIMVDSYKHNPEFIMARYNERLVEAYEAYLEGKAEAAEATPPGILDEIAEATDEQIDQILTDLGMDVATEGEAIQEPASPGKTAGTGGRKPSKVAAVEEKEPSKPKAKPKKKTKPIDEIITEIATEGVSGIDEVLKGLYELFGGASLKSFPGAFDEGTYAKAKPHFEKALDHFVNAGKGLKEFADVIGKQFGRAIGPYLKKFLGEVRSKQKAERKAKKEEKQKAAAEKVAKKAAMGDFQNWGYVYDPEKLSQRITGKSTKSAAKIILDEMVPSKVWGVKLPDEASPGAHRFLSHIQGHFYSFKEFLLNMSGPGSIRRTVYSRRQSGIEHRVQRWLEQGGTIEQLKAWADEYAAAMQQVSAAFHGQTSITGTIGKIQENLLARVEKDETGSFPEYRSIDSNLLPKILQRGEDGKEYATHLSRSRFYNLITTTWEEFLANESEILITDIDPHKRSRNQKVVRKGLPDYRKKIELQKTEDFQAPFGFKGVGFGETSWINQEERNRVIPAAYDAFKDLAATLKAPDKAMSLGGELAVQFANLGHKAKGAAAAYFPTIQTINFTRDSGDGSMSHEWGHAIHYLAPTEVRAEINKLIEAMKYVFDFDAGARLANDLLAKDSRLLKRIVSSKKQPRIEAVKEAIQDNFEKTVRQFSDYYRAAQALSQDYTARNEEMWARAFEAYVYDSLDGHNNYLVSDHVAAGRIGGKGSAGSLLVYPSGVERETFTLNIQKLVDGLEWSDDGIPVLKPDYAPIEDQNKQLLKEKLDELLETIEDRYNAIWASETSPDGLYWYQYDETMLAPMMQPDGYVSYDKNFKAEGQNGTGAIGYFTQLHPDDILDFKISNVVYEGTDATYISKDGSRFGELGKEADHVFEVSEDVEGASEESESRTRQGAEEDGRVRELDEETGGGGVAGTGGDGGRRGATRRSGRDSAERVHLPADVTERLFRVTDPTLNDPKSIDVRFAHNLAAVRVLKEIETADRPATLQEQEILSKYSGWGGMAEVFSYYPDTKWKSRADLIKSELTVEEIEDAEASSVSAYYTPVPAALVMWKLAQRLGFTRGNVLEPAVGGNGIFFGTMPQELAGNVALQGVEMDSLSARIAKKLYPTAHIENKVFQESNKPRNRFDLAITNVPFANVRPTDAKHNRGGHLLHNYFINKMLDLTAPGSLTFAITSSTTLDSGGAHLAEYAKKADLVGAIRLPSGIYSATDVATDILVFRKHIQGSTFTGVPADTWTTTGKHEETGLTMNRFFLDHPEMIAGHVEKVAGRYGDEALRIVPKGDLRNVLEDIAMTFPEKIVETEAVQELKSIDDIVPAPGTVKEGGLYINEKGEACIKEQGEELVMPKRTPKQKKDAEIAKGFVRLLDQVRATLRAQRTAVDVKIIQDEQARLKKAYNAFVKKHGPVNNPKVARVYEDVTDAAWVLSLEEYDSKENKVTRIADIFTKNIAGVAERPTKASTDADALEMSLDLFGYPNLDYMARLRGSDAETIFKGVADRIIENPATGLLETMDEYLAGNVREKLAIAREMAESNPEYQRNVSLLEAALPPELPPHRITARIGAPWIQPDHLADYVRDKLNLDDTRLRAIFSFSPVTSEWTMGFKGEARWRGEVKAETKRRVTKASNSVEARQMWGTPRMNFFQLLECALQGRQPVVNVTIDGKKYFDAAATKGAEAKLAAIQADFQTWLFSEPVRADDAMRRFNEVVNTSVPMRADGSHLTFPGKSMRILTPKEAQEIGVAGGALTLYPHQANAVWKYLRAGNQYLAHEVGTGKTITMALIAMEAKRLKGKKKILYVTLNDSTMGQATAEIKRLYPLANVLQARVSEAKQRKQRDLYKVAMNEADIVVMRQQDLDRVALSPDAERVFIEGEIQELRETLEEVKREGSRLQERDIQQRLLQLEESLKKQVYEEAQRENLFFDDLGIDMMIVDEAHMYKNVPFATRLQGVLSLNPQGSTTARNFYRKTQYLNALYPKLDSVVLASGTPMTNSLAELFNIQRMLQPQVMKRVGIDRFDRWVANYVDIGTMMEWDAVKGTPRPRTAIRKIQNAGRLLAAAFQNIDSVRAEDTPIIRPQMRGGEPQRITIEPSQYVEEYKVVVRDRAINIENDPKEAQYLGKPDNMLAIYSDMSAKAIDQRMGRDPMFGDTETDPNSKLYVASRKILERYQAEREHKGVQLVFCDMGVPGRYTKSFKYKSAAEVEALGIREREEYEAARYEYENSNPEGTFNFYDGLKRELISLGIPGEQIAFIHDADHSNKAKRTQNLKNLFDKVNAGEIRVFLGSTQKAGTGVNIQERVSDIHHIDIWWNYSAWEQRNGRGIRAGNIYAGKGMEGVYIWNYATETTVDATRWDKVFAKGKVLNAVLKGNINVDVLEDIGEEVVSARMMAADATGDKLQAKHAELFQDVQNLRYEQASFLDSHRQAKVELAEIPGRIEANETRIAKLQKSQEIMGQVTAVRFVGDERTFVFEKHGKEIAQALEEAVIKNTGKLMGKEQSAPLFVLGSHTETEAVETVKGKEKKVKHHTFKPLPVQGEVVGVSHDGDVGRYSRTLRLSGSGIMSAERTLSAAVLDGKKVKPDVRANVSRSVTEYMTNAKKDEKAGHETIAELKASIPKLESVINTPWGKAEEFAQKTAELEDVERQIQERGEHAGSPEEGIAIGKYQAPVPVLEDMAEKADWRRERGGYYFPRDDAGSRGMPKVMFRPKVPLKDLLYERAGKFDPPTGTSSMLEVLNGGIPEGAAKVQEVAYSVVNDTTRFWIAEEQGTAYYVVDPVAWRLAERALEGSTGTWYAQRADGEKAYLLFVTGEGENATREAYIEAETDQVPPQGVKAEGEKLTEIRPKTPKTHLRAVPDARDLILNREQIEELRQVALDVRKIFTRVLPPDALKRAEIHLKPILDLKGRNLAETMKLYGEEVRAEDVFGMATIDEIKALVELAYNYDSYTIEKTTYHELYHVARRWLLSDKDIEAMKKHFKGNEETEAEAFARYAMDRKTLQADSLVMRAFRRIKQLLDRIREFFRGKGHTVPDDIFSKLYEGQYREMQPQGVREARTKKGQVEGGNVRFSRADGTEKPRTNALGLPVEEQQPPGDGTAVELQGETLDGNIKTGIKSLFISATDRLREIKRPWADKLALSVENYYNSLEERLGQVNGPLRPVLKKATKHDKVIFDEYWRHHENGRADEAQAVLEKARPSAKKLIETWKMLADFTGEENKKVKTYDGKPMQVWDAQISGWRPIGKIKGFFPRVLKPEVSRVLQNPEVDPALWNQLIDALIADEKIAEREEAVKYLKQYFSGEVRNDYFAGVEKARQQPLPEFFYDYSWDAASRYLSKWAKRIAQVEHFGQDTGKGDLFQKTLPKIMDKATQNYVHQIEHRVYETQDHETLTEAVQHLNLLATMVQLGNPATAVLNLIGGTVLNMQMYGARRVAKAYLELVKDWDKVQQSGVSLGILGKDVINLLNDSALTSQDYMTKKERLKPYLAAGASWTMKWGGYKPTENIIRATGMLAARAYLIDGLKAVNTKPNSTKAEKFLQWAKRNSLDAGKLIDENGQGKETAKMLRMAVNIPQGSYRIDMTPIYVDTHWGRFLFKYQKFSTQVTRMFYMNQFKPFVDSINDPKQKHLRADRAANILHYFVTGIIGGTIIVSAREALFNYMDPGPDLEELRAALEDDDTARQFAWLTERAWFSLLGAGSLGYFGNYMQFGLDYMDQQRVKNPLDPPGLAVIEGVGQVTGKLIGQKGTFTSRDIDQMFESNIAFYRAYKRMGLRALEEVGSEWKETRLHGANRDRRYVRSVARRWMNTMGIDHKRTTAPGAFLPTPMTPINQQIYEALILGDAARARVLIRKALSEAKDREERKSMVASMRAAARNRQPVSFGGRVSERDRSLFLKWAKNNVAPENYERIRRIDSTYRRAARQAGLMG